MSGICPCGCGRRLGFNKGGAVKGYTGCTTILGNATPLVSQIMQQVDERDDAELARSLENVDRVRGSFLEHLHGEARPGGPPDLLALARAYKALAAWYDELGTSFGAF